MAENESGKIVSGNDDSKEPKNLFSLFPKIDLKIPFFNEGGKSAHSLSKEEQKMAIGGGETETGSLKPTTASFPNTGSAVPPPISVQFEESSGSTHNPVIIWQVYALGGFFILKWVWARWKERLEKGKKASSDDLQSSDEYQSPAGEED